MIVSEEAPSRAEALMGTAPQSHAMTITLAEPKIASQGLHDHSRDDSR